MKICCGFGFLLSPNRRVGAAKQKLYGAQKLCLISRYTSSNALLENQNNPNFNSF